ncbi:hypothetical protein COZ14_03165 [Candidatus Dojkabacteria bacterium CG_4_10_14_3_um_filter_Dojkabacteria_WS6_41_9]|nr:MAG: hypothetical protein COZ14_03165 [Candidatus Dojkabacteria bacterium CG_4_10_14_3_um_filter_Dojkabacteria_WS6_41_9]
MLIMNRIIEESTPKTTRKTISNPNTNRPSVQKYPIIVNTSITGDINIPTAIPHGVISLKITH